MAWVVIGSLYALMLIAIAFLLVRSRKRKRAVLCAHCGGILDPSHTFTAQSAAICRSCAEASRRRQELDAGLAGAMAVLFSLAGCAFSIESLSAGILAGWEVIAALVWLMAFLLNLLREALSPSKRTARSFRLSVGCLALPWLVFVVWKNVLWMSGGGGLPWGSAMINTVNMGALFGMLAAQSRREAVRLSEELKT